jgi:hypothetical protein
MMANGGGVAEVSLLKQGDRVYFKLKNKNETFDIYDIATRAEIEEGEVDELPIKGGKVNYAIIDIDSKTKKAIHPKDIVKGITYLDLEDITEYFYVFIKSGDYTSKYVIIPKESILIDWEKTFASWRINIKQRKKEIKEGTFKFYTGYYDSNNRFNYNKNKYANGGGVKQNPPQSKSYTKRNDIQAGKAKPVGKRYTDKLAKKLGKSPNADPTQKDINKYLGKGVYDEKRKDKSDISLSKKFEDGGATVEISVEEMKSTLGREPRYPSDFINGKKYVKCFLRPYYRLDD